MTKGKEYGPKNFKNLDLAYRQYERDRLMQTTNPALAPKDKFAQIWEWTKTPAKNARIALGKK